MSVNGKKIPECDEYTVIDIETTGLSYEQDHIIEIAALHIVEGEVTEEFSRLVQCEKTLPKDIIGLTGITDEMLSDEGEKLDAVLDEFIRFCRTKKIIGYNIAFDLNFIRFACKNLKINMPFDLKVVDIMTLAKHKIKGIPDYKMSTLAKHLSTDNSATHRALEDSYLSYKLYEKLNEMT